VAVAAKARCSGWADVPVCPRSRGSLLSCSTGQTCRPLMHREHPLCRWHGRQFTPARSAICTHRPSCRL